ncbi:putative methyltransferase-domain-containing protein [Gaertneriomyces semiglobifer]|nr:putative methyltransferase-domain-containing protein [Gaertneriomyces semiglobifer]
MTVDFEGPSFLDRLQNAFLQLIPMRHFPWTPTPQLADEVQLSVLKHTVLLPLTQQYPPPPSYRLSFLKVLIQKIETQREDLSEDVLDAYLTLLGDQNDNSTGKWYKTYPVPLENGAISTCITLQESMSIVSQGTTGLRTWEAALRFSEYLLHEPELVERKKVVELGAGVGLVGLICGALGAASVLLTDFEDSVLETLRRNIDINTGPLSKSLRTRKFDWNSSDELQAMTVEEADIIIGTDIAYDPRIITPLANVLDELLNEPHREAWLGVTIRREDTHDMLLTSLQDRRMQIDQIPLDGVPTVWYHEAGAGDVAILRIRKNLHQRCQ